MQLAAIHVQRGEIFLKVQEEGEIKLSCCFLLCFSSIFDCAYLVAQTVKNLPAMQKTHVQSLGWGDLLEMGTATHSSILAWKIP